MIYKTQPNRQEEVFGSFYMVFQLLVLPLALLALNEKLAAPFNEGKLNFLYYAINFAAITLICRRFLLQSLRDGLRRPFATVWYAILGYLGNHALSQLLSAAIFSLCPQFSNINDASIAQMLHADFPLIAIGTIFLVPVAEETVFRGLVFRKLYDRSPLVAYTLSMALFALIHVMGYIGFAEPLVLLLCFLQYLPAGYALAFAYRRSGSICAPILMHVLVNAVGIYSMQ